MQRNSLLKQFLKENDDSIRLLLRPCVPNFYPYFRVEFRVGMSFRESGRVRKKLEKLAPTLIFGKQHILKLAKTKIAKNRDFREFGNVRKARKLQKYFRNLKIGNFETRENKNFRKKRLTQGLSCFFTSENNFATDYIFQQKSQQLKYNQEGK